MGLSEPSGDALEAEQRIAWILAHPGMSGWLKDALRSALDGDPFDILNDLEILQSLLQSRSHAIVAQLLPLPPA